MTAAEVLALAQARGVTIRLDGAELELTADRNPGQDLLEAIAGCKAEIVAFLHPDAVRRRLEVEAEVLRASRPPDVRDDLWQAALGGLRAFITNGHGGEAERLGWPRDELYAVPPLWSRVDLCGVALLIGDSEVTEITESRIGIRTVAGSPQGLYRKAVPDYAAAYRVRLKEHGEDAALAEVQARVFEAVVGFYLVDNPGSTIDEAASSVMAAINGGSL